MMLSSGSPRYMSPEVLIDPPKQYNLKADVYTFGIVLWQIFSLEVPHSHIKERDELVNFVCEQHGRPNIDDNWPESIKEALQRSFDADMGQRPSIETFYNVLRFHLLSLRGGDDAELRDAFLQRRRSFGQFGSVRNLGDFIDDDDNDDDRKKDGKRRLHPQTVKNRIMNHVKKSPGQGTAPPTPRRKRSALRDKFRLSIKREEKGNED